MPGIMDAKQKFTKAVDWLQRRRKVLLIGAACVAVLAVGVLVGFAATKSHSSQHSAPAAAPQAQSAPLPLPGSTAAAQLLGNPDTPGWLRQLYVHQQDAASISTQHTASFLQLLRAQLQEAAALAPAGGDEEATVPRLSASSFHGRYNSMSSGGGSGGSSGERANTTTASAGDVQPFIDAAQDVLSYLRYHNSQALLQWLRDFAVSGTPGFHSTIADPVLLRQEMAHLLQPARLQQWYQQAAAGPQAQEGQVHPSRRLHSHPRLLLSDSGSADLASQLLSKMLGAPASAAVAAAAVAPAAQSPALAPAPAPAPAPAAAAGRPARQPSGGLQVSALAMPSAAAAAAAAAAEVMAPPLPEMIKEEEVVVEEEEEEEQQPAQGASALPAQRPSSATAPQSLAFVLPAADETAEVSAAEQQQQQQQPRPLTRNKPRNRASSAAARSRRDSSSSSSSSSSELDAAELSPERAMADAAEDWHALPPADTTMVRSSSSSSRSRRAGAAAPASSSEEDLESALCDIQQFAPGGLQGVTARPLVCRLPRISLFADSTVVFRPITVPVIFHCLAFARAMPQFWGGSATPTSLSLPPAWHQASAAANLISQVNKIFARTGIQFKVHEVRHDASRHAYLQQPSLEAWQGCTVNSAAPGTGLACLAAVASSAAAASPAAPLAIPVIVAGSREERAYCGSTPLTPAPACWGLARGFAQAPGPWAGPRAGAGGAAAPLPWRETDRALNWVFLSWDMMNPDTANALRFGNRGAAVLARQLAAYLGLPPLPQDRSCMPAASQLPPVAQWCDGFRAGQPANASQLLGAVPCPAAVFDVAAAGMPDSCGMTLSQGCTNALQASIARFRPQMMAAAAAA